MSFKKLNLYFVYDHIKQFEMFIKVTFQCLSSMLSSRIQEPT